MKTQSHHQWRKSCVWMPTRAWPLETDEPQYYLPLGVKGAGWHNCQATLHNLWEVMEVREHPRKRPMSPLSTRMSWRRIQEITGPSSLLWDREWLLHKFIMEWMLLEILKSQMKQRIGKSQHRFTKGKLCLSNPISCYNKVTCLADVGWVMDIVYAVIST